MVFLLNWDINLPSDILKTVYYILLDCMLGLGAKQQWHTSHSSKSSKQSPKNNKFQGRKTSKCTSINWDKDT